VELSLAGSVRHVNGILPMAHLALELGYKLLPGARGRCAGPLIQGIDVYPVETLARLIMHFRGCHPIELRRATLDLDADFPTYASDFRTINRHEYAQIHQLGPSLSRGRGGEAKGSIVPSWSWFGGMPKSGDNRWGATTERQATLPLTARIMRGWGTS